MNKERGFTLVEISLVIFIAGVLLAMGIAAYDIYKTRARYEQTWSNMDHIRDTLMEYQSVTGSYPCPAALDNNGAFGEAHCPGTGVASGTCDQGVCVVDSARDADSDGTMDRILIGAVPVTTMMQETVSGSQTNVIQEAPLPSNAINDGWSNRIVYAVSENLTRNTDFRSDYGAINVVDETGQSIMGTPGTAHYVLLSYGENQAGANSSAGFEVAPCIAGTAETPNCQRNGTFVSGILSKGNNAGYYDDMIRFTEWTVTNMWSYSMNSPGSVFNTNTDGNVGVGTNTPAHKLDISGGVLASKIYTKEFCDAEGNNCYAPEKIGGEDPAMNCGDANMAVKRIGRDAPGDNPNITPGEARVGCQTIFSSPAAVTGNCTGTQFLAGWKGSAPICCDLGDADCP